VILFCR